MVDGVTVIDPATTYVDDTVTIGPDTVLHPRRDPRGPHELGAECVVSAGCHVTDSPIGDRVVLKPYCVLASSTVEDDAQLGPFCHLRPRATWGQGQDRQLRGAEEIEDRPRLEGPAPLLRRRRHRGRRRQRGRGHHHLQLRRREQARDRDRRRRIHGHELEPGRAASPSARAPTWRRAPSSPRTCRRARSPWRADTRWRGKGGSRAKPRRAGPAQGIAPCVESSATSGTRGGRDRVEGLRHLEYRGYDSAGVAVLNARGAADPARGRAPQEPGGAPARAADRRAASASATRAGPPTAGPSERTRTRTPTAPAASWSCTTASSRTICRSRSACWRKATFPVRDGHRGHRPPRRAAPEERGGSTRP